LFRIPCSGLKLFERLGAVWWAEKWLPEDIPVLSLRTCECVPLSSKRDFRDVITLRFLRREITLTLRWDPK
jgi:hypothetical protein